jgi:hypothetical protein
MRHKKQMILKYKKVFETLFLFRFFTFFRLASEPKQVLRALRPRTTIHPKSQRQSISSLKIDRSLADYSSSRLPPNIYRIQGHCDEISKKKMGKLGIYKCFTVPRDDTTLTNHFTSKRDSDICDFFYDDLPSISSDMKKNSNRYKMRFLKCKRFNDNFNVSSTISPLAASSSSTSSSTNKSNITTLKSKLKSTSTSISPPFFYYHSTTVPEVEMLFNRDKNFTPMPGRYNPHDVTCKCYLSNIEGDENGMCPGNVKGNGHKHVFKSNVFRLVRPTPPQYSARRRRNRFDSSFIAADDNLIEFIRPRPPREPISFRVKRSKSLEDLSEMRHRKEFRFNTVIKRKHLVSVKTGRPVGFLTATPRFFQLCDASLTKHGEKNDKKKVLTASIDENEKPKRKPISKERLEILAMPKNSQPKFSVALSANKIFNDCKRLMVVGNITTTTHSS